MSYRLVIAEKPSVGAAYAKVLGATNRQDGYWEGNGYLVSWCIGHLVELAPPNVYDEKFVKWSVADLPILPEKFYTVALAFTGGGTASSRRFSQKADAEALLTSCRKEVGATVQNVERKEKSENPPQLYDLTTLQRDANRLLGFTAQQTLNYVQSLYEKRLITYPRTDSRFLTEDMAESLPGLASGTAAIFGAEEKLLVHVQQVINGSKVTDHHALLPTASVARADLSALPAGEMSILRLIAARLLCAVGEPYRYAETVLTTICAGEEFSAKGKVVLNEGWKSIERRVLGDLLSKKKEPAALPDVQRQSRCSIAGAELKEGQTSPPKLEPEEFMTEIKEMISSLVNTTEAVKGANALMKNKVIGACPNCGTNVVEREKGRFRERFWGTVSGALKPPVNTIWQNISMTLW